MYIPKSYPRTGAAEEIPEEQDVLQLQITHTHCKMRTDTRRVRREKVARFRRRHHGVGPHLLGFQDADTEVVEASLGAVTWHHRTGVCVVRSPEKQQQLPATDS